MNVSPNESYCRLSSPTTSNEPQCDIVIDHHPIIIYDAIINRSIPLPPVYIFRGCLWPVSEFN